MKNKKALILLLVLLVVLIGAYFGTKIISEKFGDEEHETTTVDTSVSLLKIDSVDIYTIRVINKYGDKTYFRDNDSMWKVKGDEEASINQSLLNRMATNGGKLTALDKVEGTCDNLKNYGLDTPQYTVTIGQYDGTETTFYIGMQNQVTAEYYIYVKGVDGIYTVVSTYPGFFNFDMVDLYYFDDITNTDDYAYYKEAVLNYGDNSWNLIKKTEKYEYDVSGLRAWYLADVFEEYVAADTSVLTTMFTSMLELFLYSCEVYSTTDAELEKVGLAPGNCRGSLYYYFEEVLNGEATEDTVIGSQKIWIGDKTEDGEFYYVRPDGRNGIYKMRAVELDGVLSVTLEDLMQKYIGLVNIDSTKSYSVEYGDISFDVSVKSQGEGESVTYSHWHNGKELAEGSKFYSVLAGLYAEKALTEKEKPVGKELLKITYYRDSDVLPVYEVTFYEYSVNYYKVAVNGEVSFLLNARDYKSVVELITLFTQKITYVE